MKSLRKLLDFRGNRIKNAKTDLPTDADHIVPKRYVDTKTTYNTTLANKYKNPFMFGWMKNIFNKSYDDVLDELLYPDINPEYLEPIVNVNYVFPEYIVNKLESTNITVDWDIIKNDRTLTAAPQILVTYKNSTVSTFTATSITYSGSLEFDIVYENVSKIELSLVFSKASTVKNTTHGTAYTPTAFTNQKSLKLPITIDTSRNHFCYSLMVLSDVASSIKPINTELVTKKTLVIDDLTSKGLQPTTKIINHKATKSGSYHNNCILMVVDEKMFRDYTLRMFTDSTHFDIMFSTGTITPVTVGGDNYLLVMFDYMSEDANTNIKIIK